eukprot:CAMPEP_0172157808 /NCGR_PEP_ID=MMETSP1050-20130122/4006_1 /TAXON_ID=233186 /ORGANISM="Cryptomonas curvata, Strain CCAP979/52" /LENGTH=82 /DNA_ID=CAMNT_0012827097 /DNA_START=12 /DNA_END=260 /DNA_ORIENTATION=+
MFNTARQFSELMQPADGQPYIGSIDVGGEYYGTGDASGKAFWPGTGPYDTFGLYGYVPNFPAQQLPGKPLLDGVLCVGSGCH